LVLVAAYTPFHSIGADLFFVTTSPPGATSPPGSTTSPPGATTSPPRAGLLAVVVLALAEGAAAVVDGADVRLAAVAAVAVGGNVAAVPVAGNVAFVVAR